MSLIPVAQRGLGSPQTAVQITHIATTAAATAVPLAFRMTPAVAGPVGAGIALAGSLISALVATSGCGPTCVLASNIVDRLEPQLKANRDAYLSGPRTTTNQAAALANFDAAWQWLSSVQACGAAELGDAGRRCISDRSPGGKWDWFAYYRDPIANDPTVQVGAFPFFSSSGGGPSGGAMLLAFGLLLLGAKL